MTTDSQILETLREYLNEIPSGPWDRKINIIKSIVGEAPPGEFKTHFKYRPSDDESYYHIFL
jgi:Golgi nucleoside diphosphatase